MALDHGFALAGSSYATTGWAIQQAIPDQIDRLNTFDAMFGKPTHTIAWGHSLGGIITAGLLQDDPNRFTAALPMCGVLAGGVGTWNEALDSEFAIQQLIDPSLEVVNIANPTANLVAAEGAVATAQQTAQGLARLALASALGDTRARRCCGRDQDSGVFDLCGKLMPMTSSDLRTLRTNSSNSRPRHPILISRSEG